MITGKVALERLELSQTEPESGVLPLHHKAGFLKFVALERLELSQTEPESGVLPLHHKAILEGIIVIIPTPFHSANLSYFFYLTKTMPKNEFR